MRASQTWLTRDFIAGNLAVLVALFGASIFFRSSEFSGQVTPQGVIFLGFFVIFPMLFIRLILKQPLETFGIAWPRQNTPIQTGLAFLGTLSVFGVCVWGVFSSIQPSFEAIAPLVIRVHFLAFLWYVAVLWAAYLGVAVLFQGLLMFTWASRVGVWSIVFQALVMTLWFTNKQGWENALWWEIGLICLQSLLAGGLAYRFRSVPISFYFLAIAGILEIGLALKMLT